LKRTLSIERFPYEALLRQLPGLNDSDIVETAAGDWNPPRPFDGPKVGNEGDPVREILVVDSYAKTPQQREALAGTINRLMSLERDICLVSHLPIPENMIHPGVKYVIYDHHNILGESPVVVFFQFEDMEVRCRPADDYHGAAVYASLCNALHLLAGRYERVHFVESDIDAEAVRSHLVRVAQEFARQPEAQVMGYSFYANDPARASSAILTSLFSLKSEIVGALPHVSNWEDYVGLSTNKRVFLEEWFLDRLTAQGIRYRLLGAAPFEDQSHLEGDYLVFKCRQNNALHIVFVVNRSARPLEVKWHANETMPIAPGRVSWIPNLPGSDEVCVRFGDAEAIHRHPLNGMRKGAFKKAGYNLCPDWDNATYW
jgi:hypothetical protein